MDESFRSTERALRADPHDPLLRARYRKELRRALHRDPRRDPRARDVVQVGHVARLVVKVGELPRGPDLLRFLDPDDVDAYVRDHGWREERQPDPYSSRWVRGVEDGSEVAVFVRRARPGDKGHVGWNLETALEGIAKAERRPVATLLRDLGVRVGAWIEWERAVRVDDDGSVSVASKREPGLQDGRHGEGRCSLVAWRRWAVSASVCRVAEEFDPIPGVDTS